MDRKKAVDLTNIIGEGDFPCPSCGEFMSPDDESGLNYDILEIQINEKRNNR